MPPPYVDLRRGLARLALTIRHGATLADVLRVSEEAGRAIERLIDRAAEMHPDELRVMRTDPVRASTRQGLRLLAGALLDGEGLELACQLSAVVGGNLTVDAADDILTDTRTETPVMVIRKVARQLRLGLTTREMEESGRLVRAVDNFLGWTQRYNDNRRQLSFEAAENGWDEVELMRIWNEQWAENPREWIGSEATAREWLKAGRERLAEDIERQRSQP